MSPDSNAMQTLLQNWATYFKDVSAVILHLDPVCFLELQPAALRPSWPVPEEVPVPELRTSISCITGRDSRRLSEGS